MSVYAVKKYIERNNIDRKRDIQTSRYLMVKKCINKYPDLPLSKIAIKCNLALNTVKKYASLDNKNLSKSPTNKVGVFDSKTNATIIRSVSQSQEEILGNILKLYISKGEFDCDLTTSKPYFIVGIYHYPSTSMISTLKWKVCNLLNQLNCYLIIFSKV